LYATDSYFAEPFSKCCAGKGWEKSVCMKDFYFELTNFESQIALFVLRFYGKLMLADWWVNLVLRN
jgi:hypothetical protein